MSTLAETTALLRQRDSEKSAVEGEINDIKNDISSGYAGKLRVILLDYSKSDSGILENLSFEASISSSDSISLVKSEEKSLKIKSKSGLISFVVTESTDYSIKYFANFDIAEVPDDTALKCDVDAISEDGTNAITLTIHLGFDPFDQLLISKQTEFDQIIEHMQEISEQIGKSNKKKTSTSNKKKQGTTAKVKKSKKVTKKESDEILPDIDDDTDKSSILTTLAQVSITSLLVAFEYRAVFLFGVAVTGIVYYGEYLAV